MALVPPYVASLQPYVPGKPIEEVEREYGVTGVAKLASNENPLGPSPRAVEAARCALGQVNLYPDGSAFALKNALAERYQVAPAEVFVGNGSNELIELLVRTFVLDGEEVLASAQSFVAYKLATNAQGRTFMEAPMRARFHYDLDALKKLLTRKTKLVFLANPDNPTGSWFSERDLLPFLDAAPKDTLVVLDEAYAEFVDAPGYQDSLALRKKYPNLVVLRTFSKIFGLAGLRVGLRPGAAGPGGVPGPRPGAVQRQQRRPGGGGGRARRRRARRQEPGAGAGAAAAAGRRAGGAGRLGGAVAGQLPPGRLPRQAGQGPVRGPAPRGRGGPAAGRLWVPLRAADHGRAGA